jgi:hypothetical protein
MTETMTQTSPKPATATKPKTPAVKTTPKPGVKVRTLAEIEKTIATGESSFVTVGEAVQEIHDRALFEKTNTPDMTFDSYCATRWDWGKAHAYRLMNAAKISKIATGLGFTLKNERQARELDGLEDSPEYIEDILSSVKQRDGKLTAAALRAERERVAPKPKTVKEKGETAPSQVEDKLDPSKLIQSFKKRAQHVLGEIPAEYCPAFITVLEDVAEAAAAKSRKG